MFQRLEKMKKNAFASCCLFGENNNSSISGQADLLRLCFFAVLWEGNTYPGPLRKISELEFLGARNRGGRGLSYRPARLHRLAEFIPWNRFRGPIHI
jgi:hypothetical protein